MKVIGQGAIAETQADKAKAHAGTAAVGRLTAVRMLMPRCLQVVVDEVKHKHAQYGTDQCLKHYLHLNGLHMRCICTVILVIQMVCVARSTNFGLVVACIGSCLYF